MISFDTTVDWEFPVYSRAHTAVVLPGVLSPLAWTLLGPALERANRVTYCRRLGLMAWPRDKEFLFVGRFAGRLYQNVSVLEAIAARGPGPNSVAVAAELGLQGAQVSHYQRRWTDRLWTLNSLAHGAFTIVRLAAWTRDGLRRLTAWRDETDRVLRRGGPSEVIQLLERLAGDLVDPLAVNATVRSFEMAAVGGVQELLRRHGANRETASALLSGLPGLEAAQPSVRLDALARWASGKPEVAQAITSSSYDELRAARSADVRSFIERFLAFQADFGHRGVGEADPTAPAWEQQPDLVLGMIRALLETSERGPLVGVDQQQRAAERFVGNLSPRHRRLVMAAMRITRWLIVRAEVTKSALIQHIHQMRRGLWALRHQLSSRVDPSLFTLLTWDELTGIAIGAGPPAPEELSRRRRELDGAAALNPPLVFEGSLQPIVAEFGGITEMLVGVGAAPGVVSGPAAVVVDPMDPPPTGSVLVAPATDTAWTPLFLTVDAVVTDFGSFMSHSSIVARELGIPAVVNTGLATRVIRSGQSTRVDGDRGLVFVGAAGTSTAL